MPKEKIEIKNRWSGEVQVVVEIECGENDSRSVKLGLAVKAAIYIGANLERANLRGANLVDANLVRANLVGANLERANLRDANLVGANLERANLRGANLRRANLVDANLESANGNNRQLKSFQFGVYVGCMSEFSIAIGCEQHTPEEWESFTDDRISEMDSDALSWWKQWKETVFKIHATFAVSSPLVDSSPSPEGVS